jgi:hypothetical protein
MRRSVLASALVASVVAGFVGRATVPASAAPTDTFGTTTAWVTHLYGDHIHFTFDGQIGTGDRIFEGHAEGVAQIADQGDTSHVIVDDPTRVIAVPPFTLTGTSPSGSLTATCSGEFVGSPLVGLGTGPGRSTLRCYEGNFVFPTWSATLNSVYRETARYTAYGTSTTYEGAFVGSPTDPPAKRPLPVVSESVVVDPNNEIAPGNLVQLCVTSKTLGWNPKCSGA